MWNRVHVKSEGPREDVGINEEAALAALYADHEVKQELVVGPEVVQPPDIVSWSKPDFEVTVVKEEINEELSDGMDYEGSKIDKKHLKKSYPSSSREQADLFKISTVQLDHDPEIYQQFNQGPETQQCLRNELSDMTNLLNTNEAYIPKRTLFTCDACGLQVWYRYKMVRHLHACLKKENKAGKCKICNKHFKRQCDLSVHVQSHSCTRKKEYKCSFCKREYYRSSHLYRHERIHGHGPSAKKSYTCEICDKEYRTKYDLGVHLRVHSGQRPYICQHCGKQYRKMSTLVCHEWIHTKTRPYSCQVCNKQFAVKWNLLKHKRRHENVHPYPCELCTKKFMHSYSLTKHKRKRHA